MTQRSLTVLLSGIAATIMLGMAPPAAATTQLATASSPQLLAERGGQLSQPVRLTIQQTQRPAEVSVWVGGAERLKTALKVGVQDVDVWLPAVDKPSVATIELRADGKTLASRQVALQPVRKWVVYLLPHSHNDIGYTHIQTEVEQKQWQNLDTALDVCAKTAAYPPGARFKWNVEVLWAVDSYLRRATPARQQQFADAVRAGQIELDALYGNELTGLCRPEELLRLMQWAPAIGNRCGVKVDSAMISDVPGLTWGIVSAMGQAGVKYFSLGINSGDGARAIAAWEDKPFYWLGPDGRQKVLCWVPYRGYALLFCDWADHDLVRHLPARLAVLDQTSYPYDIVQIRWAVGSDNGFVDSTLPDRVKAWNAKYVSPKLSISTTSELFREFEKRYADKIPVVRGDFTPYWENGACSSARETALNRMAAERLVQAEALDAMFAPRRYPVASFTEAWRNAILYDEHTWGAYNSIEQPDLPFVKNQWKIKQAFALDADAQSHKLLTMTLGQRKKGPPQKWGLAPSQIAENTGRSHLGEVPVPISAAAVVDVWNTSAWPRTDLVTLDKALSVAGDVVVDADNKPVLSQRLSTGQLAFLAKDVPALAGRRYTIAAGKAASTGEAKASGAMLATPSLSVRLDPISGAIASLRKAGIDAELSDTRSGIGLNRYYYVLGTRVKEAQPAGPAHISVGETGPLVASLRIESDAPGCVKLSREIRLVDGLDRVDIVNTIDKKAVREKEGVHLGYAFNVPDGVMRMDIPWAVMRPELDQIAGACKNWFSVGRWADVSNRDYGVTWATLDAPMVLVGGITIDKIGSLPNPKDWLDRLEPTQTLYSMVMNNHWWTNYKADQAGPTVFRYSLLPHGQYDQAAAQRFGIERSQPLVASPARGDAPDGRPLLQLDTPEVLVASIKPSNDHKAWIVRLFGAAGKDAKTTLRWGRVAPKAVSRSNLSEEPGQAVEGPVDVPAYGLVTLRAELPQ